MRVSEEVSECMCRCEDKHEHTLGGSTGMLGL